MIKKFIKKILPASVLIKFVKFAGDYLNIYFKKSYSLYGEDMILAYIFRHKKFGFYIDIGAHHPKRFSNTNYLYKKGWSGINIDAMPGSMKLFNKFRRRDINLETPIGNSSEQLTYFIYEDKALNGFDKDLHENIIAEGKYKLVDKLLLNTESLENILDDYLPLNKKIDFMNVDVEGMDIEVLKSNNWEKYRPEYILVEILNSNLKNMLNHSLTKYLNNLDYYCCEKTIHTVIFKSSKKVKNY
jgi:hypothetical protein